MAYSNVWSKVDPVGGVAASSIDDEIRKVRVDLEERLLGLFASPFTTDPLVPLGTISGKQTGKKLNLPWNSFNFAGFPTSVLTVGAANAFVIDAWSTVHEIFIPIPLLALNIIQRIQIWTNPKTRTLTGNLYEVDLTTGAGVVMSGPWTAAGAAYIAVDSGAAIAKTLVADRAYAIGLSLSASSPNFPQIYGATITYDSPDSTALV